MTFAHDADELGWIKPFGYMASPYTLHSAGLDGAAKAAARCAGSLLRAGVQVYSPIAHCHSLATSALINPRDRDFWLRHCRVMFEPCGALIVAMLEGWRESFGVGEEIKWARELNRPIFWLEPRTLRWTEEAPESVANK